MIRRLARYLLAAGASTALIAVIIAAIPKVPSFEEVHARWRPSDAQLLDRNGDPINETRVDRHGRRLAWVPLRATSPALIEAVIDSEDRRFRDHCGVDLLAAARALGDRARGRRARGASTITMQVASMVVPGASRRGRRRTMAEKILQMFAALALEHAWSKDQILEAYLNLVTWRGEMQGIGAAARVMMNKNPGGITSAEAIVLASLVRAPNASRRALALRAANLRARAGALSASQAEMDAALDAATASPAHDSARIELAPHLAQRMLRDRVAVRSTIDRDLQRFASDTLRRHVAEVRDRKVDDGAVLVVENRTGEVWAYVGGTGDLSAAPWVDGVRAMRQPGSALKPFLYALAIDERILTPASMLEDTPLELPEQRGIYRPMDYDRRFRGLVSMRTALGSSLNIPAVRTADMIGIEAFASHLRRLGFDTVVEPGDFYGGSIALGSTDVSLWQLVNAYRTLANGGVYSALLVADDEESSPSPSGGTRNRLSRTLHKEAAFAPSTLSRNRLRARGPETRIYTEAASFIISDILSDRASRSETFGLENSLATRFWSAVKTGTSKDMRDNWCVGYTERFTVGVWVGNFSGLPMRDVSGITGAAPVWLDIMNYLNDRFGSEAPRRPPGVAARAVHFPRSLEADRTELFLAGTEPDTSALRLDAHRVRIASPADGSTIALDPDIPPERQRVSLTASRGARGLHWILDHRDLGAGGAPLMWTPVAGSHELWIADSSERPLDRVRFIVRGK